MALFGQDEKVKHLRQIPIFNGCSRRELAAVARIADLIEEPSGKVLTQAGEPGKEFFLILDGTARVEVSARKRVRLGRGDFFGEMSLLDGEPRSATVIAETPLRLLVIGRREFWVLLNEIPQLTRRILVTLSQRLRQAQAELSLLG